MTEFKIEQQIMSITSECSERQLGSKQDIARVFTLEQNESIQEEGDQPIDVILVMDGHGHNVSLDVIKEENLCEHFAKLEPAESLQQALDIKIPIKQAEKNKVKMSALDKQSFADFYRNKITNDDVNSSGETLSFAKIYRNTITKKIKIFLEWLGDSPIIAFVNNELVFQSETHHASNETEIKRLIEKQLVLRVENADGGFKVLGENTIQKNSGKYVVFNNGVSLALTRSLGHHRITGIQTQKHFIECSTDDEIKIVMFSDGVGDVLNMDLDIEKLKYFSAEEIVDLAEKRWKQVWNYNGKNLKFPSNGYDDCCCSVWQNKKYK